MLPDRIELFDEYEGRRARDERLLESLYALCDLSVIPYAVSRVRDFPGRLGEQGVQQTVVVSDRRAEQLPDLLQSWGCQSQHRRTSVQRTFSSGVISLAYVLQARCARVAMFSSESTTRDSNAASDVWGKSRLTKTLMASPNAYASR